jgi:pimeloyl-ACP methyl ester carboxylesterase
MIYADQHQLERFHLFGHSFGGRLGLILGAKQSERIITLTLADSAGIRPALPFPLRTRLTVYKGLRDGLKRVGMGGLSDRLRTWYNRRYGSADFQDVSGVMRETFVNVVNEDLQDTARRVAVPTLLLWGEADEDTPLAQGQLLEQLIPDAGLVVFPGAGHYSYLEQVEQSAQAMTALFASTPPPE